MLSPTSKGVFVQSPLITTTSTFPGSFTQNVITTQQASAFTSICSNQPLISGSSRVQAAETFSLGATLSPQESVKKIDKHLIIKWRDMTVEQRKEVGGTAGYANLHGIDSGAMKYLINGNGLTSQGLNQILSVGIPRVEPQHLHTWLNMSAHEKGAMGGVNGFALHNQLNVRGVKRFINHNGLTLMGMQRLSKEKLISVSASHLKKWLSMTLAEREECGGAKGFAFTHHIRMTQFKKMVNMQGLTDFGRQKIEVNDARITECHLRAWQSMTLEEKHQAGSVTGFACSHRISVFNFQQYANMEGLTAMGLQRLERSIIKPVSKSHLAEWFSMTPLERKNEGGTAGFALKRKIALGSFKNLANGSGLLLLGLQRLFPHSMTSVERRHLEEWQSLTVKERLDIGGATGYARKKQINLGVWRNLAVNSGLNKKGEKRLKEIKEASDIYRSLGPSMTEYLSSFTTLQALQKK